MQLNMEHYKKYILLVLVWFIRYLNRFEERYYSDWKLQHRKKYVFWRLKEEERYYESWWLESRSLFKSWKRIFLIRYYENWNLECIEECWWRWVKHQENGLVEETWFYSNNMKETLRRNYYHNWELKSKIKYNEWIKLEEKFFDENQHLKIYYIYKDWLKYERYEYAPLDDELITKTIYWDEYKIEVYYSKWIEKYKYIYKCLDTTITPRQYSFFPDRVEK